MSRAEALFKFMDYDFLTDNQRDLVINFEERFVRNGYLSQAQLRVLESINKQASERDRPLRR